MSTEKGRMLAFLLGCMGTRLGFAYIAAYKLPSAAQGWRTASALAALLLVAGWIYIYSTGARPTGAEAGGPIWWNDLRPIHASFYAAFAVLILTRPELAYIPLVLDVLLGFGAWARHRLM